ncbi:MAG: response regulator [Burkholderiales bacterium]|nr:response regulator [Burkholderiales bacterium]
MTGIRPDAGASGREAELLTRLEGLHERLVALEQAVGLGMMEFNPETESVRLDRAARVLHGLRASGPAELPLNAWAALLAPEDQLSACSFLGSEIPDDLPERLTVRVPGHDPKKPRLLELSMIRAPRDRRLLGACRDVTQERTLEELRRQKAAAERASRAKSEFMSHISHELRTPLNAILGFGQIMAMDEAHALHGEQLERLDVVRRSSQQLLSLIDQLLQVNRIEQGRKALQSRSVDVQEAVRRSVDALKPLAASRGVEVSVDIDRPGATAVRGDPQALEQVLANLLSNAIKYNRSQGKVRLRFRGGEAGEFTVEDTGLGLNPAQLGQLFEPFNRLDAESSGVQGTGLGLVISKQLIEAMGGSIEVASQPGIGSRFVFRLPLARRARSLDTNTVPLDMPSQWDTGRKYSVLYVEDDDVNQLLMEQVFKMQPEWRLQCVRTGTEGIVWAVQNDPDAVLLDMNLPDMSGLEVFERLQRNPRTRGIPCVAVSADAMPAQIQRAHARGFADYWIKPLDLPATIGKLKQILR